MNNNYDSYKVLHVIMDEGNHIYFTIELNYNNILILNHLNELHLVTFNKEDNKINDDMKEVTHLLISPNKSPFAISKISKKIICLNFSNCSDFDLLMESDDRPSIFSNNISENIYNERNSKSDSIDEDNEREKSYQLKKFSKLQNRDSIDIIDFKNIKNNGGTNNKNNDYEKFTKIVSLKINDNNKNNNENTQKNINDGEDKSN